MNNLIKPSVEIKDIEYILKEFYGLQLIASKKLNGYDDLNFYVSVKDKENNANLKEYVVKVINSLDSQNPEFFDAQSQLLLYLGSQNIICSKPIQTKLGEYFFLYKFSSGDHIVRLLTYIDGNILHNTPLTPKLFVQCGQLAAKLDLALKGFTHAAFAKHVTPWSLDKAEEILQYLHAVSDPQKEAMVLLVISEFKTRVLQYLDELEKGMIHGDCNEQNILTEQDQNADWNVKGILDFGDSHWGCYLFELAITMTYLILDSNDISAAGWCLSGYSSVKKLPEKHIKLLKICVQARICQSLVMGAYSGTLDPNNTYALTTQKNGWQVLKKLYETPEDEVLSLWKEISENNI